MAGLTYINAGTIAETSNNPVITPALPAGISIGRILLAIAGGYRNGATTYTWSSGWTSLGNSVNGSSGVSVAYRIATGADVAPTLTTNTGAYFGAQVFQYSGVEAIGAYVSAALDSAADSTPGFTTLGAGSTRLYITASYSASGDTVPTGFTRDLRTASGNIQVAVGRDLTPEGAVGSIIPGITFNRGVYGGTFHIELIPAAYSEKDIPRITASGYAYSEIASSGTIPSITASGYMEGPPVIPYITASGTAATGSLGSSTGAIPLITATGTAEIRHTGNLAKTLQSFTKSMTAVQQPSKVMQNFQKSMEGHAGIVSSKTLQVEHFQRAMQVYPVGAKVIQLQGFQKTTVGLPGVIGSSAKVLQFPTIAKSGYVQVTGVLSRTMRPFVRSLSGDTGVGLNYTVLSMHTEWQALTQYTNYPFNSFARFNGVSLGASSTGLYRLTGDTDNGTAIAATARVGISDLGTSHLKKAEYVYVGCRATGDLMLRVNTNDSHVRDYRIKHNGETGLHVKRVKLGKGVVARYWQFEVQNLDGADFDLNTLEVKPTVLSRRISSGRA